jgi:hypothetical protein
MDDYSVSSLVESKNEWCARLVAILTPLVIEGIRAIFDEAWNLCSKNEEKEKYLMTFQSFLGRVPSWNSALVNEECKRVQEKSGCSYLADLIACVHIIQLKALSCVRVGTQQKKIEIMIPSVEDFVHKVYINTARKVFSNVYLFEKNIAPLQVQKHNRELELIIKECIMTAIRESIPVEDVLRAYMEETEEKDTLVQEREDIINETPVDEPSVENSEEKKDNHVESEEVTSSVDNFDKETSNKDGITLEVETEPVTTENEDVGRVSFSDKDSTMDERGNEEIVDAPKTLEILQRIEDKRSEERAAEEDDNKLSIGSSIDLEPLDINEVATVSSIKPEPNLDIAELPPL